MASKGAIVIDTRLNDDGVKKGWQGLLNNAKKLASQYNKSVDNLSKESAELDKLKNKLDLITSGSTTPPSIKAMESELKRTTKEAENLKNQLDSMDKEIETKDFSLDMTKSMYGEDSSQYQKELAEKDALIQKSAEMGEQYDELSFKAQTLSEKIQQVKLDPSTSVEAQDLANKIELTKQKLEGSKEEANGLKEKLAEVAKAKFADILSKGTNSIKSGFDAIGSKIDKFKSRMSGLIGTAMVFSLIRNGLNALRKELGNMLNSNAEFANSLNQIKANLMTAFTPIYNAILPALNALMSALSAITGTIATFIASIFGQSASQAKANAKALNEQANAYGAVGASAEEAQGKLASFDTLEVNDANKSGGGGGGGGGGIDFGQEMKTDPKVLEFLNKCKEILATLFAPFKRAWDKVGKSVIASAKKALSNILDLTVDIGKTFLVMWDSDRGESIATHIFLIFKNIFDIIGNIAGGIKKAWNEAGRGEKVIGGILHAWDGVLNVIDVITKSFADLFATDSFSTGVGFLLDFFTQVEEIVGYIADAFAKVWSEEGLAVLENIQGIFNAIFEFATLIGDSVQQWVMSDGFQTGIQTVIDIIKTLVGWIKEVCQWVVDMYEKYVKPIIDDKLIPLINTLIEIIGAIWEVAKPVIDFIVKAIETVLEPVIKVLCDIIGGIIDVVQWVADLILKIVKGDIAGAFQQFIDIAKSAWEKVKSVFSTVASFFGTIFGNAWEGVKNIFSTGGQIFMGIVDGIANAFKNIVNKIISGINNVVAVPFNAINSMLGKLRGIDVLGVQPFSWIGTISVPQIPQLATGAVAYAPMLAEIGEYAGARQNPEIVAPSDMIRQIVREEAGGKEVIIEHLEIVSKIGEDVLRRQVMKNIRLEEQAIGKPLLLN